MVSKKESQTTTQAFLGRSGGVTLVLYLASIAFASSLWGDSAKSPTPLSLEHTKNGVSQLIVGNLGPFRGNPLKLGNPNDVRMAAAAIIYESDRGFSAGTSEVYLTCNVKLLTPHAAEDVSQEDVGDPGVAIYGEVISAPLSPVTLPDGTQTRLADGLGLVAGSTWGENSRLFPIHPLLFSLPANSVVNGQREAARNCICGGVFTLGLPADVFAQFPTVGTCQF